MRVLLSPEVTRLSTQTGLFLSDQLRWTPRPQQVSSFRTVPIRTNRAVEGSSLSRFSGPRAWGEPFWPRLRIAQWPLASHH